MFDKNISLDYQGNIIDANVELGCLNQVVRVIDLFNTLN